MISTSYPENVEDWRGRFIANLAGELGHQEGIDLSLWAPPGTLPPRVKDASTPEEADWLLQLSRKGGIAHVLRQEKLGAIRTATGLLARLRKAYRRVPADVLHINWLQNALPLWGTTTPAVISVLGSDFDLLRLPGMKTSLRAVFRQRRTVLTPNAEWMHPLLERNFGDVAEIRTVPFGVDEAWFDVQRKPDSEEAQNWLAITRLTKNKIGDLFEWSEGLFGNHRQLHLFGPLQENLTLPDWVIYHGPTHTAELLNIWFPKATGLVSLSRHHEGRPQVMLEAMAAGIPVIASNLPAHRDIIQHKLTGWLADTPAGYKDGLDHLESPSNNLDIGNTGQRWAREAIGTWDDCARRYTSLYRSVLEANA